MALTCEQIQAGLAALKDKFSPCYRLTAADMDELVDLIEEIRQDACDAAAGGVAQTLILTDSDLEITQGNTVDLDPLLDNKAKLIEFGSAVSVGSGPDIAREINNLPVSIASPEYKTVKGDEIVLFRGFVTEDRQSPSLNTYMLSGKGKGIYGASGGITVTNDELILIESSVLGGNEVPVFDNDPNAVIHDIGILADNEYATIAGAIDAIAAFDIEAGTNHYFEFTVDGNRFVYGYSGINGSFGNGGTAILPADLFLIYDEGISDAPSPWEVGTGYRSVQVAGGLNSATGLRSLSSGTSSAVGDYSVAMGHGNTATGGNSFVAGGDSNNTIGGNSFASGAGNTSNGWISSANGLGNTAWSYTETVVGTYATQYTPAETIGWDDGDSIFRIGIGVSDISRRDALDVKKDGLVLATELSTTMIDNAANRVLTTKEWVQANSDASTGLEAIDEGNGVGWRLIGRDSLNYGNIGNNAIDLSLSGAASAVMGATGIRSFAIGINNISSGTDAIVGGSGNTGSGSGGLTIGFDNTNTQVYSIVSGSGNSASSTRSILTGINNTIQNDSSIIGGDSLSGSVSNSIVSGFSNSVTGSDVIAGGISNVSSGNHTIISGSGVYAGSYAEASFGCHGTTYTATSTSSHSPTDRVLNIGNGTNGLNKSDAFTIYKNGGVLFHPTTTPTNPTAGMVYYDSATNKLRCHNGTIWNDMF